MEWLSYEDLRIQLAIYGSCMELNFQVKRSPVSQPLAQTVLYIGTSLALPTSRGTNQHLIALQESKTLVDQGTEKGFPWICLWPVPITSLLELSERWISAVCLRSRFFFFFIDIASTLRFVHPEMSSQEGINVFVRPERLECTPTAQKTINYMLMGS